MLDKLLQHVAHDAFWEFSNNLHYLVYSPVFRSARVASELVPFQLA